MRKNKVNNFFLTNQLLCFTRVVFNSVFALHLQLRVLTASEQLSRCFVYGRTVLAPAMRSLGAHLEPVVGLGPERGKHYMFVHRQFATGIRFVASRIELDLRKIDRLHTGGVQLRFRN